MNSIKVGITGGIGSGKSYVCRLIEQQLGVEVYDCDSAAKRLMRTSLQLRQQLTELIGPDTYGYSKISETTESTGASADLPPLNKAVVAQFLLASPENARAIDTIVHPAVFADFEASGLQWVESAILYESGLDRLVDRVIVVTAPEEVRIERVMRRDGITAEKARQWIARQLPQEELQRRADYEIVNDGLQPLAPQIDTLTKTITKTNKKK